MRRITDQDNSGPIDALKVLLNPLLLLDVEGL
jgi:hypothetical protein